MVAASRVKTNWLLLDDLEFWDEFTTKAITDPDTEYYFKQINQAIDDKLAETIKWLDSDEAKEYFQQEAEYQEEVFEALEDEWDDILSGEIASADELLDRIYEHGKQQGYNDIREKIRYTDADRQALQFAKDYNFHLIQKLDDNLRDAIKKQVIQAVASGEHPYELAPKIQELGVQPLPGSTLSARHRAVMIARTETARVQNTGIIQSYVNEGFTEVNILTAEDSSVCRLCLANAYEFNTDEIILENRGADRTHKIKDMNGASWVPLHPNCRCTYVVVWDSRGEAPENPQPVDLIPDAFYSNAKLKEIYGEKEWKQATKKSLGSYKDTDLGNAMLTFEEDYLNELSKSDKNKEYEWGQVYNITKDNFEKIRTDKKHNKVNPFINDYGNDELYVMHNHREGTFLSPKDFSMGFYRSENIKGVTVHIEDTIFIAKFKGKPSTLDYMKSFIREYNNLIAHYGYNSRAWLKFNSNKILNKYIEVDFVIK